MELLKLRMIPLNRKLVKERKKFCYYADDFRLPSWDRYYQQRNYF
jgi:hypothetical protein